MASSTFHLKFKSSLLLLFCGALSYAHNYFRSQLKLFCETAFLARPTTMRSKYNSFTGTDVEHCGGNEGNDCFILETKKMP
jgi:hypothetical protein